MSQRIVIDPLTRIEGHLRIEADLEDGQIRKAYSSGTMVRGIELILKDRDPREAWAFAQRICGVCTSVHALAAIRAVEDALDINVPLNASLIRKIMTGTVIVQGQVVHFYQLHSLDWVNPELALKADPGKAAHIAGRFSNSSKNTPAYFQEALDKLKQQEERKQFGIFSKGYWNHPGYKLPPEVNLIILAHYMDALVWQSKFVQIHTLFGGKNPHPNYLVGGIPSPINMNSDTAINADSLLRVKRLIDEAKEFVDNVYLPDLVTIASYYKDWFGRGEGLGNFLVLGEPELDSHKQGNWLIPPTFIQNRDLTTYTDVDYKEIKEYVSHSWYDYSVGDKEPLHPYEGETNLHYSGPKPPFDHLNTDEKYSWVKAPRYKGLPVEMGTLSRTLALYARDLYGIRAKVDKSLTDLGLPFEAMFSTMGRTLSRGLDAQFYVHKMDEWYKSLLENIKQGDTATANTEKWDPDSWPADTKGYGLVEAPRGSLSHWAHIKNGKIENYQAVVPTTWNASPRDAKGQASAYEASLVGHDLWKPEEPLEILRTIHSFDPCMACAVHFYNKDSEESITVRIL